MGNNIPDPMIRKTRLMLFAVRILIASGLLLFVWIRGDPIVPYHIIVASILITSSISTFLLSDIFPLIDLHVAQICIDTVLMMPILQLTGGTNSPFIWIVFLILIEQEFMLTQKQRVFLLPIYIISLFMGITVRGFDHIPFIFFCILAFLTIALFRRFRGEKAPDTNDASYPPIGRQDLLLAREELLRTAARLQQLEETTDIFHRTAESLMKLIPCEAISYYRIDWDARMLTPVVAFGKDAEKIMAYSFSLDTGISGAIAISGRPEIVNDALKDPRAFHVPGTPDEEEAIMGLPIAGEEYSIGVFCLYRMNGRIFSSDELETARLFSTQAQVAIKNASLLKELKRRTRLLSTVLDIGRDIHSSLDIEEICRTLDSKCSSILDTDDFFIALLEEDYETVHYLFLRDRDQTIRDLRLPYTDTIAGYAIKSGGTVMLTEETFEAAARRFNRPHVPRSGLVTPLHAVNRIVGAMSVQSYEAHAYDEESMLVMEIIARQAGAALHNAYLYKKAVRAFEEMENSQDEIIEVERNRLKGEIGRNISHEFNNLLAAILGRTEVLLASAIDKEFRQQIESIHQSASAGTELIGRVADMPSRSLQFDTFPIPLDVLLRSELETSGELAADPLWEFTGDSRFPLIHLPRAKAELMVRHLAGTIRSSYPKGGRISVSHAGLEKDKQTIHIQVRARSRPDLPESASLLRGIEKDRAKGARLARLIIRDYGGELQYRESVHGDISFMLTLPVITTADMRKDLQRILIVDDEDSVREVLSDMTSLLGYEAVSASSGEEALVRLGAEPIDIVVTDVGMPGMDGLALLESIRKQSLRIPVILVTGWGTGEYDHLIDSDPLVWVLCKPIQVAQIQSALQEAHDRKIETSDHAPDEPA